MPALARSTASTRRCARFFSKIARYAILVAGRRHGARPVRRADRLDHRRASAPSAWPSAWRLQGTLQNIAAGIMLLALRPFRIGEYVEVGGVAGTDRGDRPVRHPAARRRRHLHAGAQFDAVEPAGAQLHPQRRAPQRHHASASATATTSTWRRRRCSTSRGAMRACSATRRRRLRRRTRRQRGQRHPALLDVRRRTSSPPSST